MRLKLQISILLICISQFVFSQKFNHSYLLGKWSLISEVSEDSSIIKNSDSTEQEYYNFFKNGTYKHTRIRNDDRMKGTFYSVGKWKIISGTIMLYNRRPEPNQPNVIYHDLKYSILLLSQTRLILYGNFSIGGEGNDGSANFKKIK